MKLIILLFLILNISTCFANVKASNWYSLTIDKQVEIQVDLFFVSNCPSCDKIDRFFYKLKKNEPWIKVHRYTINQDKVGLQLFHDHLLQQHSLDFSTPTFFFCDSRWKGGGLEEDKVIKAILYCHQQINHQGQLSQETVRKLQAWSATYNRQYRSLSLDYQRINQMVSLIILVGLLLWICIRPCYRDRKSLDDVRFKKRTFLLIGIIVLWIHLI